MRAIARRLVQLAVALALGSSVVLVTQWAYPAGQLAIHLERPQYSRMVGDANVSVRIELRVQNVGIEPVKIDRAHFLLVDNRGDVHQSDPATHFLHNHLTDTATVLPLHKVDGTTVFRIPAGRTATELLYVTTTGEIIRFKLS